MKMAVIPARGGSKRIPRKNIKLFYGKPMIAWSIEAAKSSGLFDIIIVSTDDEEVAEVATNWGAVAPFIRPVELSNDFVGTAPVIAHSTKWAINEGYDVDAVCCIYATAPFIQVNDIRRGLNLLNSSNSEYAIAVTNFAAPIFRSFRECSGGGVEMIFPEHYLTRSQDLQIALHDAGQFNWGRTNSWIEGTKGLGPRTALVKIPRWRVQDIDDEEDWKRAELLAPLIFSESKDNFI
jgi:N-acylneuraminate cytidylyltransferase